MTSKPKNARSMYGDCDYALSYICSYKDQLQFSVLYFWFVFPSVGD